MARSGLARPGLRAAVRTSQIGVCSLSSACGIDQFVSGSVCLDSCCSMVLVASDPGLLVEGIALDENLASTLSLPAITASTDVVFLLGGIVVEPFALPTQWREISG